MKFMEDVRIAVQIKLSGIHPFIEPRPHSLTQGEDFPTLVGSFMSRVIVLIFFKSLVAGAEFEPATSGYEPVQFRMISVAAFSASNVYMYTPE